MEGKQYRIQMSKEDLCSEAKAFLCQHCVYMGPNFFICSEN